MSVFAAVFEKGLFQIQRSVPGVRDALGRPTSVFGTVATVDGILQPTGTLEGEAFVVDQFRAIMPLGTDLRPADRVLSGGRVYTVQGTPFEARPPGSKSIGIVTATLKYTGPVS